jgi:hypothetical protein
MSKTSSPPTVSKAEWARANDRGPHVATLPTGSVVKFEIADASMLLRNGKLPEHLRVTAQLAVAHADGVDGYFQDLVQIALMRGGDAQATIAGAIQQGVELSHHLVAEMLIEPAVTAAEVASGMFHELDIRMLLEFAERRRNIDAAGQSLPIMVLDAERWARFRHGSGDDQGAANGAADRPDVPADVPDAHRGAV